MKKRLIALLLALCLVVSCGVTAFAVDVPKISPTQQDGKDFSIEYTGTADGMYVLLILAARGATEGELKAETEMPQLDVNSILYIDQQTAGNDGKVTFNGLGSGFQMKSFTSARVYVGGTGLAQPQNIGYIKVDGVSTTGTITFEGEETGATVKLLDKTTGAVVVEGTTDKTGAYTLDPVPAENYTLTVKKSGHCLVTKITVEVGGETPINLDITPYSGDVDDSENVDIYDINALLSNYRKYSVNTAKLDIDEDEDITIYDINFALTHYGAGEEEEGVFLD